MLIYIGETKVVFLVLDIALVIDEVCGSVSNVFKESYIEINFI